jgi:hypothetical protein
MVNLQNTKNTLLRPKLNYLYSISLYFRFKKKKKIRKKKSHVICKNHI